MNIKKRTRVQTSSYGEPGRISHDSTPFYANSLYKGMSKEKEVIYEEDRIFLCWDILKGKVLKGGTRMTMVSKRKEMTLEEIRERYRNEWVLVEVLEEDELQRPVKVRFITHSENRDIIYEALRKHKGYTYHFYTGTIPKEGYVFECHER